MAGSVFVTGCRFNPTAGGTTDWTYSSAVTGYNSPALSGIVNGSLYSYRAEGATLSEWEWGQGAYNTGTGVLARTTVLYNSSGTGTAPGQSGAGTKINFSTTPQVAIVALAEDLLPVVSVAPIVNSLGADVSMSSTASFFDGPSVAQGSTGTWFASGTVTIGITTAASVGAKLWDGTTVIASAALSIPATSNFALSLSGFLAAPAGNLRISCRNFTNTTGIIAFNATGNSKDSTISAFRIK